MPKLPLATLAAVLAVAGLAVLRPVPATAAPTHDVFVVNPADAPAQVALAHADEPFHLTTQANISGVVRAARVALITADRKMVIDHVSGRLITGSSNTGNFALELEEPGRKTVAVHEVPLTQAWDYGQQEVPISDNQRLRMIASQPMRVIVMPGQTLYFHVEVPYNSEGVAQLTVSGHYAR